MHAMREGWWISPSWESILAERRGGRHFAVLPQLAEFRELVADLRQGFMVLAEDDGGEEYPLRELPAVGKVVGTKAVQHAANVRMEWVDGHFRGS